MTPNVMELRSTSCHHRDAEKYMATHTERVAQVTYDAAREAQECYDNIARLNPGAILRELTAFLERAYAAGSATHDKDDLLTLADALARAVDDEHRNEHGYWSGDHYRQTKMDTCQPRCQSARRYTEARGTP